MHPVVEDAGLPLGLYHHPEDAFLAVSGRDVGLYTLGMERLLGTCQSPVPRALQRLSSFSSVSVANVRPYIAAGTEQNGVVALWDYNTQQLIACDKYRHGHKKPCKVSFSPREPDLLYSVGQDGILKMQDVRVRGLFTTPTAVVNTRESVTCMSIQEETGDVAVGCEDGIVLMYSRGLSVKTPRHVVHPAVENPAPVIDISWQHSYHNITQKISVERATLGLIRDTSLSAVSSPAAAAAAAGSQATSDSTSKARRSPATVMHDQSGSKPLSYNHSSHIESQTGEQQRTQLVHRDGQRLSGVALHTAHRTPLSEVSYSGNSTPVEEGHDTNEIARDVAGSRLQSNEAAGSHPLSPQQGNTSTSSWHIRAGNRGIPGVQYDDNEEEESDDYAMNGTVSKYKDVLSHQKKQPVHASASRPQPSCAKEVSPESGTIQEDILALHLDMLNMFKEQQKKTEEMMTKILERQDMLSRDVAKIQHQLQDVLTRRGGASSQFWL